MISPMRDSDWLYSLLRRMEAITISIVMMTCFASVALFTIGRMWNKEPDQPVLVKLLDRIRQLEGQVVKADERTVTALRAVSDLRHSIVTVNNKFLALSPEDRAKLDGAIKAQSDLEKKIATLQEGLGNSPERMLAVPLMRKDVDLLKDQSTVQFAALQGQVSRLDTTMQWCLNGLFAGLVLVCASLLTSWVKGIVRAKIEPVDGSKT